jgi:hypothetical protein
MIFITQHLRDEVTSYIFYLYKFDAFIIFDQCMFQVDIIENNINH